MPDPGAPPSVSLLDSLRVQALVFEELRRIQNLLTERLLPPVPQQDSSQSGGSADGEVLELLRRLQVVLIQHPLAAQATFSALVAEGRRFAATPEGAAWKDALAGSDLVRNGHQLWEAISLNLLEEEASTVVPSTYLEAVFRAISSPRMDELMRRLWSSEEGGGSHGAP